MASPYDQDVVDKMLSDIKDQQRQGYKTLKFTSEVIGGLGLLSWLKGRSAPSILLCCGKPHPCHPVL